jgi:hypothetical protein
LGLVFQKTREKEVLLQQKWEVEEMGTRMRE